MLITLGLEALAQTAPDVSFVHDYPGTVKTPFLKHIPVEMLRNQVFVPLDESGERHLYLITSVRFAAAKGGCDGVRLGGEVVVARGTTGMLGSGVYSVGSDCESASSATLELIAEEREKGMVEKVWQHTEEEYKRITVVK